MFKCSKRTDEHHGWECSVTEGAYKFYADKFEEGTDSGKVKFVDSEDSIVLGISEDYEFEINFNIDSNVLIEGRLGCGKTYLLKSIAEQTLKKNYENKVYVISKIGHEEFNHLNITEFVSGKEEFLRLLINLNKERTVRTRDIDSSKFGRIVVLIDGIESISTNSTVEDKEVLEKIEKELVLLSKIGNVAKINIFIAGISSEYLLDSIRSNISTRIYGTHRIGEFIKV